MGDREAALRLDLGHEMAPDPTLHPFDRNRPWIGPTVGRPVVSLGRGFWAQYAAAADADLRDFRAALAAMERDPEGVVDIGALRARLRPIVERHAIPDPRYVPAGYVHDPRAPRGQRWRRARWRGERPASRTGNSAQDLALTAYGWHFAALIEEARFRDRASAADWLARNLGA